MRTLTEALAAGPFQGYAYAYPHKTAYRALPPRPLAEVWDGEPRDALALYVHIPFCSVRCGFCNLFAVSKPGEDRVSRYLDALESQARQVAAALPGASWARVALGGGTPTYLSAAELERLVRLLGDVLRVDLGRVPAAIELSPETTTPDRVALLRAAGFQRVSLGVQSLDGEAARALGRPQRPPEAARALDLLREAGFPVLNLDLIYGAPGQPAADLAASLRIAVARWRPEEIYLYPLYVRRETGLGRKAEHSPLSTARLDTYRAGRALLLAEGYEQVSMRMFRGPWAPRPQTLPDHRCQDDGMVGLGAGARSYTRDLHYAGEFAVPRAAVTELIDRFSAQTPEEMARVRHGFRLAGDEQRRRWLIQSLLQCEGLERSGYRARFGADPLDEWPSLAELCAAGLADLTPERLRLTPAGIELSDALGPWLYSDAVRRLMSEEHPA
jgi:oxygen-independent coproporphyrinogen III oxidase